ncbi:MAG: hypothetical protein HY399_01965 [Elusimicrobia bacterium]|nr:hypothetical protein [Elusimicrobiota bacterium]
MRTLALISLLAAPNISYSQGSQGVQRPVTTVPRAVVSQTVMQSHARTLRHLMARIFIQKATIKETLKIAEELKKRGATPHALAALTISLQSIRENLVSIARETRMELSKIPAGSAELHDYTKTYLDFTNQAQKQMVLLEQTIRHISQKSSAKNKGKLRDALNSKRVVGHSFEPSADKATQRLDQEMTQLKTSSDQLLAAAKWLNIATKSSK